MRRRTGNLSRPAVVVMTSGQLTPGRKAVSGLGTSWYAGFQEEMQPILMTQRAWTSPNPPNVC